MKSKLSRIAVLSLALGAFLSFAPSTHAARRPTTHKGVIQTVTVDKSGNITKFHVRVGTTSHSVKGCGMKSADHPYILWALDKRRTVHVNVDARGCFAQMDVVN